MAGVIANNGLDIVGNLRVDGRWQGQGVTKLTGGVEVSVPNVERQVWSIK